MSHDPQDAARDWRIENTVGRQPAPPPPFSPDMDEPNQSSLNFVRHHIKSAEGERLEKLLQREASILSRLGNPRIGKPSLWFKGDASTGKTNLENCAELSRNFARHLVEEHDGRIF